MELDLAPSVMAAHEKERTGGGGGKQLLGPIVQLEETYATRRNDDSPEFEQKPRLRQNRIKKKNASSPDSPVDQETSTFSMCFLVLSLVTLILICALGYNWCLQANTPLRSQLPVYIVDPLQHETRTKRELDTTNHYAGPLLTLLEKSFSYYLDSYPCLCMHHLQFPDAHHYFRVCAVKNLLMVSLRIVGISPNTTDPYIESSVSCQTGTNRTKTRYRNIVIEWTDGMSHVNMYATVRGREAACLQQAVDEMDKGIEYC